MASKGKVLVIDDDPDFCEFMRIGLEADGFEVLTAATGKLGLELMRREKPNLVFLDVVMAHPTEGVDVTAAIKEDPELWDIPIIMLTSIMDTEYIGHFPTDRPLPVDQFLTKPVPMAEVLRIANETVGAKS
ncbi:MAG: response regulator [Ardenticatenia bacterium]|jgi:response regulator RpfG family c-di-GMP phosphodiesterase|nr:MAG: response regulator [Ardenticatenia bacterium]